MKRLLLALVLPLAFAPPAAADDFDDASAAYRRGDYTGAVRLMQPLAEQGEVRAQYALGAMYVQGFGVPQNNAQAMKWFQLAAAQGDERAQYTLSVMYSTSQGSRQGYVAAADPWIN